MEFFKQTTIDFMGIRKWCAIFSLVLCAASLVSLCVNGLSLGLDFTGGTQIQLAYQQAANLTAVRADLGKAGFDEAVVQSYGGAKNVLIRIGTREGTNTQKIAKSVVKALPDAKLLSSEFIGPQVGKRLAQDGAMAVIVAMIGTAIYIALRFEYRFAISAMVALLHDPILILGLFSLFGIEFDLYTLVALLTVIGYSLNDTIVVFDRVRENFRKVRRGTPDEIVNISVNQTLSRTIMTSGLTLIVVIALLLYGGAQLHGFSLSLVIGIVIGTYSSIYVAGALAVALGLSRQDLLPPTKKELDDRP